MQLSDHGIAREIRRDAILIRPYSFNQLQPATYDLLLADDFAWPDGTEVWPDELPFLEQLPRIIKPGEFMLGSTTEFVAIARNISGQVKGKSTWARKGLMVECAGFVDPGFEGNLTLELKNLSRNDIALPVGRSVAQIAFSLLETPSVRVYGPEVGSHYQGQRGVTPAAY